jgi:hypothetical protein
MFFKIPIRSIILVFLRKIVNRRLDYDCATTEVNFSDQGNIERHQAACLETPACFEFIETVRLSQSVAVCHGLE